jgi:mono/diheme cytochrome c family protein
MRAIAATLKSRLKWPLLLAIIGTVALACSTGTYPVDVFTEMHYQQSYRSQEPPRVMPAEGAVPFTDESEALRPAEPPSQVEALTMANPVEASADNLVRGQQVFTRNCAVCHGISGTSDSFISVTFTSMSIKPPANFAEAGSITADGSSDGLAFWIISDGLGNMPAFRHLLSYEDRWGVIHYLRLLSEQAGQ